MSEENHQIWGDSELELVSLSAWRKSPVAVLVEVNITYVCTQQNYGSVMYTTPGGAKTSAVHDASSNCLTLAYKQNKNN